MTIRKAIIEGSDFLKNAGIQTSALDASILLCYVLKTNRSTLTAAAEEELASENRAAFQKLLDRRINGECVAYIIEKKEFYGLEFFVNHSALVPRPETEILVETALEILKKEKSDRGQGTGDRVRILDLCTGSGAIAIALKHQMPELEVHATDISAQALETAKINATLLLPDNNQIHFYHGDLFEALPPNSSYSLIVSNPPYICSDEIKTLSIEVQNEPRLALDGGETGLDIIEKIINKAPNHLQRGGLLLLEADPRQMENIKQLLAENGFEDINLYKDLSGQNRIIGGCFES